MLSLTDIERAAQRLRGHLLNTLADAGANIEEAHHPRAFTMLAATECGD